MMQFENAYAFLIEKLEQDLPKHLTYHNVEHTKEVLLAAQQIAKMEEVHGHDLQILNTAALFHDAGFLEGTDNHEKLSCKIAREHLPNFGYSDDEIEKVCKLIMVTKLPQTPTNKLESILCDADLYYLGTERYLPIAENLYVELKNLGHVMSWEEWQKKQVHFLKSHKYFTATAIRQLTLGKSKNLLLFKAIKNGVGKHWNRWFNNIRDTFLLVLGVVTAGFALEGFLVPNHFLDGGVTGISLLVHELLHIDLSYITVAINLPFIIASFFVVGRKFAVKTLASVLLLGVCLLYIHYPIITSDKLLISIFGGFFLGMGSGLAMRGGCALDGVEVLALYTFKKTNFTISEIILGINILIFGIAAFKFGIETSLYSLLTYFTASKTIDYVVEGVEAYTGVTIISGRSELIKTRLVNELGRSITVYKGERGFLPGKFEISNDCDIIFTVITRLELRRLKNLVNETDPNAFVFANTIKEASGGILKHRAVH